MTFPRHFGLGVAVGVTGAATFFLLREKVEQRPRAAAVAHKALKFGSPSINNLRFFDNFVVAYDARTRNPLWVLEHVTRDNSYGDGNRKNVEFKEDASFEERFRAHLSDFRGSGYDRGHMAPAANHKSSQKAMEDTFLLTNISPQVGKGFNRDYWARFERFVKQLSKASDEVFVVTGPLFMPNLTAKGFQMNHPLIGEPPRLVSVPTHFYKVILCSGGEGPPAALAAFVMPNAPIPPDLPLTSFAVPLEALESAAGLHFFPGLISHQKREWHDKAALSWQAQGRRLALEERRLAKGLESISPLLLEPPKPTSTAAQELPVGVLDKDPQQAAVNDSLRKLPQPPQNESAAPLERTASAPAIGSTGREEAAAEVVAVPLTSLLEDFSTPETRKAESSRLGFSHLCDNVPCELPPTDWYLKRRSSQETEGAKTMN